MAHLPRRSVNGRWFSLFDARHDGGQRRRLIEMLAAPGLPVELDANAVVSLLAKLPEADAERLNTAWAFRRLVTASQFAIRRIANSLRVPGAMPVLADAIQDDAGKALSEACNRARTYLDSVNGAVTLGQRQAIDFAAALVASRGVPAAAELVRRAEPLLRLDGDRLIRGPAFSVRWLQAETGDVEADDAAAVEAAVPDNLPPRLAALLSLLRDCEGT